jgi:isoquinoline 1-oxidoreductase alpha subunit
MAVKLNINGKDVTLQSSSDTPLLWALRDELNMTGTKYGCGVAQCGACTVHVNGVAQRSCQLAIGDLAGDKIKTIEGLGGNHRVQLAWIKHDVPQCGYCQSGQIMTAAALVDSKKATSDKAIVDAMDGNLCRCGTYNRIHAAVKEAAGLKA